MKLRPYQQQAVDAVYQHLSSRDDNPCVVLPTGTGKSLVIAQIALDAVQRWNGRVLVLAHVKELLEQNAGKISALCPEIRVGVYSAGLKRRDVDTPVLVAGIQSVYKRAEELGHFDLIIVDECHLIPESGEGEYRHFFQDALKINPYLRIIGLTATPYRMNGGLICKPENMLNHICYEAGIKEMIAQGYLSPLRSKEGGAVVDTSEIHTRCGEFVQSELEEAVNDDHIVRYACEEIVRLTADRKAVLIFCVSVDHCRSVAQYIEKFSGQECAVVTGDTPAPERAEILDRIKGKQIPLDLFGAMKPPLKYIANVNVLTTGFDAPVIDCVAILRPTLSAGLLVQMVGRGTRLCEGKENCMILDYGGNIMRHGPIDSIRVHDYGGGRNRKASDKQEAPVKKCEYCKELVPVTYKVCPACGQPFPPPEVHHDWRASTDAIISGETKSETLDVQEVSYTVWEKRNNNPNGTKTMKVTYRVGLADFVSEWVCPEHTGYAREKFEKWWNGRCVEALEDCAPNSAEHAVFLANLGCLAVPKSIKVRIVAGEKFPRVTGYVIDDIPDFTEDMQYAVKSYEEPDTEMATPFDEEEDIPF